MSSPGSNNKSIEFSLVAGGPFHSLLSRLGLLGSDRLPTWRTALVLAMLAWLPPAVLSLAQTWVHPGYSGIDFFMDGTVYTRYLVAIIAMVITVKNKSKTITAEVEVPEGGGNGAIIVKSGHFGGWALYIKDGVPAYDYNFLGFGTTTIVAGQPLGPGKATIRFEFAYDGGGMGKGGEGTLFVNGKQVASGRIEHTQPIFFSADETADVGIDLATPVVESIGSEGKSRFTGTISGVTVEVN